MSDTKTSANVDSNDAVRIKAQEFREAKNFRTVYRENIDDKTMIS